MKAFNIVGKIISQMWRLVVGCVLPADPHAVDMVVHECGHTVGRWNLCAVDIERASVSGIPHYYLLTPVAEEVGLQAWV